MTIITFLATAVLVYVALAAFAYHDAYGASSAAAHHEDACSHEQADPRLSAFFVRLALAGAIVTVGIVLLGQCLAALSGPPGVSVPFGGPVAQGSAGIALVLAGMAVLSFWGRENTNSRH